MMTQDIDTTEKDGHKKQEDREVADFITVFFELFFFILNFICMGILPACMSEYYLCAMPRKVKREHQMP